MTTALRDSALAVLREATWADKALRKRQREAAIERTRKAFATVFRKQGRMYLERLPKIANLFVYSQVAEGAHRQDIDDIFNDVSAATRAQAEQVATKSLADGVSQGYAAQASEFGLEASFKQTPEQALSWAREHAAAEVTSIDETTRGHIRNLVEYGIDEGESYSEVAASIRNQFEEFSSYRSELIAVQENAMAYESGSYSLVKEIETVGIKMEKSLTGPLDGVTSEECQEALAVGWIPTDEPFPNGEMTAPIHIGCRHATAYRVAEEPAPQGIPDTAPQQAKTPSREIPAPPPEQIPTPSTPQITSQEWAASASTYEERLVGYWQGSGYESIRAVQQGKKLPSGLGVTKTEIKKRAKELEALLDRAPTYTGKAYRGLYDLSDDALRALTQTDTLSMDALSSATTSRKVAERFVSLGTQGRSVLFEITSKTGVDIQALSRGTFASEKEILLRRGSQYRVKSVAEAATKRGVSVTKIILEEI